MPLPVTNELIILSAILGLAWGSFVLVVADRLEKPKTVFTGRSICLYCKNRIAPYDLIPVLSFVFLRGRCRGCHKPIGLIYPAVEILFGIFFALCLWRIGLKISLIPLILSVSFLAVGAIRDIRDREVDLYIFILGIVLSVVWFSLFRGLTLESVKILGLSVLVAAFLPASFAIFSSQKWMGYGDILFALWVGIISGYPGAIIALFTAFLLGSIFGIIQIGQGRAKMRSAISFGPFLAIGSMVGLFFGQDLFSLYLKLFGL